MVAPITSRSSYITAPSALDPRRNTSLVMASFSSEWYFKPEGVALVKRRFEGELARLEQSQAWDYQVENRWGPEHAMWQVRCAKVDYDRVWKAFFIGMNSVITEAIRTANQRDDDAEETGPNVEVDEDDEEDYAFAHDEPLDSNLVQRLTLWKMQTFIKRPTAEVESDDEVTQTEPQLVPVTADETYPPEIRFYKYREAWRCGDKSIMLDDLLPEVDLKELVRLTGCQFSMDINKGIMFVGAHEEENILLAVHKLDNIERNLKYRHPWANYLFYNEDTANVKYFLKYFVDVRQFYFDTTLLDNLQVAFSNGACDYEALTNAVTVRCAPKDHVKSDYIPIKKLCISNIKVEDIPGGVRVFSTAFTYNGKGNSSDNPMLHRPVQVAPAPPEQSNLQHLQTALAPQPRTSSQKDDFVQRWATDVPDALSSGIVPINGLPDALRILPNVGTGGASGNKEAIAQKPAWDRYEEYSPEKVANVVKNEFNWNPKISGPIGLINRPLAENIRAVSRPRARVPIGNGGPHQPSSAMPRSTSMPQVTIGSDGLMEPLKPIILHQKPLQPLQPPPQPQQSLPVVTQQVHRTHVRSASHTVAITPQPNSSNRRLFSETIARSSRVQPSLLDEEDPFAGSLSIGVLAPITRAQKIQDEPEKEQLFRESEARVFHQTMNQRAPRPKQNHSASKPKHNPFAGRLDRPFSPTKSTVSAPLADPVPEFVEEVNRNSKELMAGLRGYRGKVVVQAEFGRIIIGKLHHKHLSSKDHLRLLDGPFLQGLLLHPTQYGPTVDFTSVLTAVSAEIQHMVNMKSQSGQDLWEKDKVARWNTTYEFVFTDLQNPLYPVMIEIDAETFVAQIKARCRLGNLFVFGTKRHWDVKLAAIGYGDSRALEDKYGDLATEVQSSLYIPPNSHRPYLSWKLATPLQKQFVIQEVIVRRVYEYNSIDKKSLLKVSELQSLDINGGPAGEKPFWIFEATPGNPDLAPIDKLTTWYEASITSVHLDAVLKQNESLDLGDETAWTLEDVANMGACKALYSPALAMLKQMDGVGQNSKNGSDYRSRQQAARAMLTQAAPQVVWW
ncbi:hypothetical protein VTL71DRAFT_13700 [Oculimacula yallundae]|uniref:Uncharacterized protein n=1 Tax=Oculimacula yallundae TaxID=86028 RepID=A0ABR4CL74_9HELO